MIRRAAPLAALAALFALALAAPARALEPPCEQVPRAKCFGIESLDASLSTTQAGAHPDLRFDFALEQDPESAPNVFGLHDAFSKTRTVRIDLPPGLIADPNVLGVPQQCTIAELTSFNLPDGGCPNGSQIGLAKVYAYELNDTLVEPVYMMQPPGGEVVGRVALIAGIYPVYVDAKVRTEGDYGLSLEFTDTSTEARLIASETTTWGVPADPSHDTERCTAGEALFGCEISPPRPPGSRPLPFITNPTRCGVPLQMRVSAASWAEPERFDTKAVEFPELTECDRLPFGPGLTIEPTNHRAGAPVGLDVTARLPASDGVEVLEPAQVRDIRVRLPEGLSVNTGSADGLEVCSEAEVSFGKREDAHCPDAAKLAGFEALIPALPRRLQGAIYLRQPEPGNLFRFWAVADDLGAHVKLKGQLVIDEASGQIESVLLDNPQVPLREVKILFKSGFRAPLLNPGTCGSYASEYEFTSWAGSPPVRALSPIEIDEGCDTGGFDPQLSAGSTNPAGGRHSPFLFTLTRSDGEQNPAALDISLPPGLSATFAGIPRCEGAAAQSGACPAASRIGRVIAAVGAGAAPLWVPQPGKRPTAVYLGGPYKGEPLSIVAVVPAQAGPFDLGDEVVRSAIHVDPVRVTGSVRSDPLPQIIEGIPIHYRTIQVQLDDPDFVLNPTSCAPKSVGADVTSAQGATASPSSPFQAVNCARLGFKPRFFFRLRGGTRRGAHPSLRAVVKPRAGDANFSRASVALPHSEFLDQGHIGTVCTRVQFAAHSCPRASIYGHVVARTPLLDEVLRGPVYLRSSSNPLPDLVAALRGPDSLPVEVELSGRIDSVNGGIRTTFQTVPDTPVSSFVLTMRGGHKGLLVNSTNLCRAKHRVTAKLHAQNGRRRTLRPLLRASCKKRRSAKARHRRPRGR